MGLTLLFYYDQKLGSMTCTCIHVRMTVPLNSGNLMLVELGAMAEDG
eukprot:SAG25_NODE_2516_length_1557_cov_1.194787_2_plen_47_part_00